MISRLSLAAVAAFTLAGAAVAQGQPVPAGTEPGPEAAKPARACFFNRDVRGFAAPDDKTLYLRVRSKDIYRLDLKGRCPDLDWETQIGLDSRGSSSICAPIDVQVRVRGPIGVTRCPVSEITRLTPEEAAALPRKSRP
jgi:hypothetical protein